MTEIPQPNDPKNPLEEYFKTFVPSTTMGISHVEYVIGSVPPGDLNTAVAEYSLSFPYDSQESRAYTQRPRTFTQRRLARKRSNEIWSHMFDTASSTLSDETVDLIATLSDVEFAEIDVAHLAETDVLSAHEEPFGTTIIHPDQKTGLIGKIKTYGEYVYDATAAVITHRRSSKEPELAGSINRSINSLTFKRRILMLLGSGALAATISGSFLGLVQYGDSIKLSPVPQTTIEQSTQSPTITVSTEPEPASSHNPAEKLSTVEKPSKVIKDLELDSKCAGVVGAATILIMFPMTAGGYKRCLAYEIAKEKISKAPK